ncbi:MAG: NAD-dependent epimerase/dehydratase family protein [Chthoniobacter sp.]|uniref:NAD-dependent epimerase/dehydratase family protein n=1 Tax=Chthoniobacter sp. TaxID=2510640 RepID=UPI0032A5C6E3
MGKTVIITGVAGFLGRHVAQLFAREGWRVVGIDEVPPEKVRISDLTYHQVALPDSRLAEVLRAEEPQACIHCAGCASVGLSMDDPAADFRGNVALVFEVLEALRRHAPRCRFLLLSSAAVYGDPATLPVTEKHDVRPLSPYGYHKRQAELLCEEFSRIHGLPTASARIFSAYGPGLRRQVVWDICEKVLSLGKLALRGTGAESRDFIHATDIAHGLHILTQNAPCEGEIYNLSSGREVTIAELAGLLVARLGSSAKPSFDGRATPGNPLRWRADITKIAALGFAPTVPFESGIDAVTTWARAVIAGS